MNEISALLVTFAVNIKNYRNRGQKYYFTGHQ